MNLARMSTVNVALMNAVGDLARAEHPAERESLTQDVNQLARAYTARTRSRGLAMARTKASLYKMFRLSHRGGTSPKPARVRR
jgi:hypothetical protein